MNKAMTRKEKIIEILKKYQGLRYNEHRTAYGIKDTDYNAVTDAIMAIPIEVPSEEEIKNQFPYAVSYANMCSQIGAKWAIEEIKRRNRL